jgi:hypothetical protein
MNAMDNHTAKPAFHTWERASVDRLCHDLWDQNVKLRDSNEQLRQDNKDLSNQCRNALTGKAEWK